MATTPLPPSIPPALLAYLLEAGAMVRHDAPADDSDQRALAALKTAQVVRRSRRKVAELPALQDDPTALLELARYLDGLADLVKDRHITAGEVGLGWARIKEAADALAAN
ncbi:hypothetical protein GCM10023196_036370 [Actinoallomurus vinaceus]|uniref:Uncharacterized protein n=1 Tax=Actinoallomurus vinaceus TaxID=1080074 RepID=A0ABP8UBV1_9ACTN